MNKMKSHIAGWGAFVATCIAAISPANARTIVVDCRGGGDFATIQAAADVAQPGDEVIVSPGVYREEVRVAASGRKGAPIVFRSATRGGAVIKGSDVWTNEWQPLPGSEGCFESEIDAARFKGRVNPYVTTISISGSDKSRPARPVAGADESTFAPRTLGQIFVGGEQLTEVTSLASLRRSSGTWMVSYDGRKVWIHPQRSDFVSSRQEVEWSVRSRVFHAQRRGFRYIVLDGFVVEHGANQGPFPQIGLVDTRSGMDWTIQNCVIRHAKTIGLSIGGETWDAAKIADVPEQDRRLMTGSGHLVRNCVVSDCGAAGIAGWQPGMSYIVNNVLERNNRGCYGWPEKYWGETAAIKLHISKCVIAGNVIRDNDATGIWLDTGFDKSRVTGNIIVNNRRYGVMLESAYANALIDNNVIAMTRPWDSFDAGDGVYSHNGSCITVAHNLVFGCAGAGVRFRTLWGKLQDGRAYETSTNSFVGNIFCLNSGGDLVIACTNSTSRGVVSDYNVYFGNTYLAERAPTYPFRFANYNIGGETWTGLHARVSAAAGTNAMPFAAWRAMGNPATLPQWRVVQGMDEHSFAGALQKLDLAAQEMTLTWSCPAEACAIAVPPVPGIDRDYLGNPYPEAGGTARPGPFQDTSLLSTNVAQFSIAPAAFPAGDEGQAKMAAKEVVLREGLGGFIEKCASGAPVTVAYLGGSITEMDGWRRLTTEWLRKQFPKAQVKEVAAAIGGTGSDLGVFRLGHDALDHDPDLLFVEFATNDRGRDAKSIIRQMEGIVRQTWAKNAKTDIVFVYTITDRTAPEYAKGGTQQTVGFMEKVAEHYGIPSVDFGYRVLDELNAGRLVMTMNELETAVPKETPQRDKVLAEKLAKEGKILFAKDGVHPALPGHGVYLKSVQNLFAKAMGKKAADHAKKLAEKPLDAQNLEHAKMVPIVPEMLKGEWTKSEEMNKRHSFVSRMNEIWETKTPGSKLVFAFDGTSCRIYDLLGPDGGQVWVTVDGKRSAYPLARFDSYCTYHRTATLFVYDGKPGRHTVEIELDSKQPSRQPVAFRLKDPETELKGPKYNGTRFWPAKILIVGDLCE